MSPPWPEASAHDDGPRFERAVARWAGDRLRSRRARRATCGDRHRKRPLRSRTSQLSCRDDRVHRLHADNAFGQLMNRAMTRPELHSFTLVATSVSEWSSVAPAIE